MGSRAYDHYHGHWGSGRNRCELKGFSKKNFLWKEIRVYTKEPLRCQIRPSHYSAAFTISERLILRAILVVSAPDLDIGLWNAILVEEEEEEKIRIR